MKYLERNDLFFRHYLLITSSHPSVHYQYLCIQDKKKWMVGKVYDTNLA